MELIVTQICSVVITRKCSSCLILLMRIQWVFSEMVGTKEEGTLVVSNYWVRFAGPAVHQADEMICEGAIVFLEKKPLEQKVLKKWFVQQTVKIKFFHKTGRKIGLYRGKKLACSFAWEEKKGLFLVRSKKKTSFHRGKNHSPTTYHLIHTWPGKFTWPTLLEESLLLVSIMLFIIKFALGRYWLVS